MKLVHNRPNAFSLIEAAIVLAVIGLVIGGIWTATDTVRLRNKTARTVENILTIVSKTRSLFPLTEYPSTDASANGITNAGIAAGVIPKDWVAGNNFVTSYGVGTGATGLSLSYYLPYQEMIALRLAGREGGYSSGMNQRECQAFLTAFMPRFKDQQNLIYAQIQQADAANIYIYPPATISSISCPADFLYIVLWFRPT